MPVHAEAYQHLKETLPAGVTLVAVSKTKPVEEILALYELGQRDFGENYVQELVAKQPLLPADIRWHFIGHLQSNKVKFIAPFIHLIHGVDSQSVLKEVARQGAKFQRVIDCLLQVHIAREETKFGFDLGELGVVLQQYHDDHDKMPFVRLRGLMGMATNDCDALQVREEFKGLETAFAQYKSRFEGWDTLSMGMSMDYHIAIQCGSTMIRIGSLLFGSR